MRRDAGPLLVLIGLCLLVGPAAACPEVPVAFDPGDPSLEVAPWRAPAGHWRSQRFEQAHKGFHKAGIALEREVERLFRPGKGGKPPSNAAIQRFLAKTLYARPPALQVSGDRFFAPSAVLWAWADSACRAGQVLEAHTALKKLARFRDDAAVRRHLLATALRLGRVDEAATLLRNLPPEGFLSPYAEAVISAGRGQLAHARERLRVAEKAAITPAERSLVESLSKGLAPSEGGPAR